MSFPTGSEAKLGGVDNGVLRLQRARGRFFLYSQSGSLTCGVAVDDEEFFIIHSWCIHLGKLPLASCKDLAAGI